MRNSAMKEMLELDEVIVGHVERIAEHRVAK
jgi:hypothetical protein